MRILLVEDDPTTSKSIELMLTHANLNVYATDLGEEGIDLARLYDYDLILLDLNLPDINGHEVLRQLRMSRINTPILILSGADDTENKIKGFGFGADDYLTKPFAPKELSARIRALLRRSRNTETESATMQFEQLEIAPDEGAVRMGGIEVHLTRTEFQLLVELGQQAGRVLSREDLLERVWGYDYFGDGRLVDVHIRRLRTKIEPDPAPPRFAVTVRGMGYKLQP